MKLLILDDEWYAVKGLSEGIEWSSYNVEEVFEAFSAAQAFEILEENDITVIICDIEMPDVTGLDFAEKITAFYPQIQIIFLTGHANFDYARKAVKTNAFDYILKPAEHKVLIECVQKAMKYADEQIEKNRFAKEWKNYTAWLKKERPEQIRIFWRNVIANRLNKENISVRMKSLNIKLEPSGMITPVAVWIEDYQDIIESKDEDIARFILAGHLENEIVNCFGGYTLREEEGIDVLMLLYGKSCGIEEALKKNMPRIGSELGCRIAWRIGETAEPDTLWWSIYRMKSRMVEVKELPVENPSIDWEALIERRSKEQLHKQVDLLVNGRKDSPIDLEVLYHTFYSAILSLSKNYGFSQSTIDCIREHDKNEPFSDLSMWMHRVVDLCIKDIETGLGSRNSIIENVCRFIHANLGSELTRDIVAAHVFLHPVYLSRIFKQETGSSLMEFITLERMKQACILLKNPEIKISSVAKSVGYSQISYFSRVFRKIEGISPKEYQRNAGESLPSPDLEKAID